MDHLCHLGDMLILISLMVVILKASVYLQQVTVKIIAAGSVFCKTHHRAKLPHVPKSVFLQLGTNQ